MEKLFLLLDHQQSLLQNYRSITVMFQTFLIAIAGILLNLISSAQNSENILCNIFYIIICGVGSYTTYGFWRTCNIRASYVDSLQNIIYAIEKEEILMPSNFPLMTALRSIQQGEIEDDRYTEIYKIIKKSKIDSVKFNRSTTRFVLTYLFHGTYAGVWLFFIFIYFYNIYLLM